MDQHPLAGLKPGAPHKRDIGGQIGDAIGAGLSKAKPRRLWLYGILGQDRILGKGAKARSTDHGLTDRKALDALAQSHHLTGQLHPNAKRQGWFELILAARH